MTSPAPSPPDAPADARFDVAVIALSARALARSAARGGLRALAFDLFADADTREHAVQAVRTPARDDALAFDGPALLAALEDFAPAGLPVVLGAGFESATDLMRAIDRRNPIRGATPDLVDRLKQPFAFAGLLADLGIAAPRIAASADGPGWLSKAIGGSGGWHIRDLAAGEDAGRGRYAQARVAGSAVSALFLADGRAVRLLGLSEQWCDAGPTTPFRYGGAVGPLTQAPELEMPVEALLARLVRATGLVGLASADMLAEVDGEGRLALTLLEINPRPGATLDVFDRGAMPSLLAAHLAAVDGRLPAAIPPLAGAAAAAVVYAAAPVGVGGLARPVWASDWPGPDERIPAGAPVCTVAASAATCAAARGLVEQRRAALLETLQPAPTQANVPDLMVFA